jgi:hypothetical protein
LDVQEQHLRFLVCCSTSLLFGDGVFGGGGVAFSVFGGIKKLLFLVYLWAKIYICLDEI